EEPRLHGMLPAVGIRMARMPELVAGMHAAIPGDEGAALFDKTAAAPPSRHDLRKSQIETGLSGNLAGLLEGAVNRFYPGIVHGKESFKIQGDAPVLCVGPHGVDEIQDPLL